MCHAARSKWGVKAGCAWPGSSGRLALFAGGFALLLDVHANGEDEGAYSDRDDKDAVGWNDLGYLYDGVVEHPVVVL